MPASRGATRPGIPWAPRRPTPADRTSPRRFPAYPSGHATFGGALFEVLRAYVPDATPFTFVSDEFNGKNKDVYGYVRPKQPARFTSLTDAEQSNGMSRIWIGVHWRFDSDEGIKQGNRLARHVLATFAQPV